MTTSYVDETGREAVVRPDVPLPVSDANAAACVPLTAKSAITFGADGVPADPPEILAGEAEQFKPSLHSNPGYFVVARLTDSAADLATTFDTGVAEVYSGQTLRVVNTTDASVFLHMLLIDADGNVATGETAAGAKDIMRRGKE